MLLRGISEMLFLGREKINEIDLSVGRNILFLFKFVNPIDQSI